jgi:predicted Fe-S protein YdhL (DUF1289 family)
MKQSADQTKALSPCINVCALDDSGFCKGCFRTVEEITRWSAVSNDARLEILANARLRREKESL